MKIFNTYNKARFFFVKPKIKFFLTTWFNSPAWPVWRHGPEIRLFKKHQCYNNGKFTFCDYFLTTLKRWGLDWIKPVYYLPRWLTFRIDDFDVSYKTKWTNTNFRFEERPFYKITIFGISLTIMLVAPNNEDGDYWESILTYNHYAKRQPYGLKELIYEMGWWRSKDTCGLVVDKAFIHPEYHNLYDEIEKQYLNEVSKK